MKQRTVGRMVMLACAGAMLGGCVQQSLREQYIAADDACANAREPIVAAGEELDKREREAAARLEQQKKEEAEKQAAANAANPPPFSFKTMFADSARSMRASNSSYLQMFRRKQINGADAAALLASVNGDAGTDRGRLNAVTKTMKALRTCRAQNVAAIQADGRAGKLTPSETKNRLGLAEAALKLDDQLIAKVFGEYGTKAEIYASASAQVGASGGDLQVVTKATPLRSEASTRSTTLANLDAGASVHVLAATKDPKWQMVDRGGVVGFMPTDVLKKAPEASQTKSRPAAQVDAFRREQAGAELSDKKESDTLHETIQNALAGSSRA